MSEALGTVTSMGFLDLLRRLLRPGAHPPGTVAGTGAPSRLGLSLPPGGDAPAWLDDVEQSSTYPGDFNGPVEMIYAPHPDGAPDPGEVVWTWVPYEEDYSQGKDRPVLLIGWDGDWLLGLQLTSQDHDRDAEQERRAGREWVDIGSGAWDSRGRPSEVRVNRIIRVDPGGIRRQGAVLSEAVFERVRTALAASGL